MKLPGTAIAEEFVGSRLITLSRQYSLNSVTLPMIRDLYFHYIAAPPPNPNTFYILKGDGEKSFSVGGDVLALTDPARPQYATEYYRKEYQIDYHIATMARPQIALWRGHVLGSGVGVSLHSRYRVACESTTFGMPETKIGTVPDVGSTFKMLRANPRFMGAYMAITGTTVKGADAFYLGFATHYVSSLEKMDKLERELTRLCTPSAIPACLAEYCSSSNLPPFSYAEMWGTLEKAFTITGETTISSIMQTLRDDGSPFARVVLQGMEQNSPLAMTVALENWKYQSTLNDIRLALEVDYNLASNKGVMATEFDAGVDALLISKTKNPKWQHRDVKEVNVEAVRRLVREGRPFLGAITEAPTTSQKISDFFCSGTPDSSSRRS